MVKLPVLKLTLNRTILLSRVDKEPLRVNIGKFTEWNKRSVNVVEERWS